MKILILGSEGFIGSNCITHFLKKGYDVSGCDLLDYKTQEYNYYKISRVKSTFDELFVNNLFDFCINAAGNGSVPISMSHPISDFEANCLDVINLLQLLKNHTPNCKYLHISSAAVYGNPNELPIKENSVLKPLSPYGWHKLIAEKICEEYSTLYNLRISIIRPFSVYGPGLRKQLFWDLFQKLKLQTKEIELWGSGTESRDFIYISDLISLIDIILTKAPMKGESFNAANGYETTILEVSSFFYKLFDFQIKTSFNQKKREGDPINWRANIDKIKELGYKQSVSLEQGISKLFIWMKSQK